METTSDVLINSKKTPYITHIIFSGGGLMGLCYLGIIRYMYIENMVKNIKFIAGTSIGAFFGIILALQIPIDFIENELDKIIRALSDNRDRYIKKINILQVFQKYGVYDIRFLMEPVVKYIKNEYGVNDLTFIEFVKKTGINFYVSCTCVNTSYNKIFSVDTTPNSSVIETVLASMSIPFFIVPNYIDGEYFVDGVMSQGIQSDNIFLDVNKDNILGVMLYSSCEDMIVYEKNKSMSFANYIMGITQVIINTIMFQSTRQMELHDHYNVMQMKDMPYNKVVKFKVNNDDILIDLSIKDMEDQILRGFIDITKYMNERYNK